MFRIFGRLFKIYVALLGVFILTACGGGGGSPGTPLLGANSPQGWSITMAGVVFPATNCSNQNGGAILCNIPGHNNTADPSSGAIIENYGAGLGIKVVDSNGNPISGASVTFSLGSFGTGTTGNYCNTATTTTTTNCTANGVAGVRTTIQFTPGFANGAGKVTTPITVTTGSDGRAYVSYYPGGQPGIDVVLATAQTSSGSGSSGSITQAAQSATMVVQ